MTDSFVVQDNQDLQDDTLFYSGSIISLKKTLLLTLIVSTACFLQTNTSWYIILGKLLNISDIIQTLRQL